MDDVCQKCVETVQKAQHAHKEYASKNLLIHRNYAMMMVVVNVPNQQKFVCMDIVETNVMYTTFALPVSIIKTVLMDIIVNLGSAFLMGINATTYLKNATRDLFAGMDIVYRRTIVKLMMNVDQKKNDVRIVNVSSPSNKKNATMTWNVI